MPPKKVNFSELMARQDVSYASLSRQFAVCQQYRSAVPVVAVLQNRLAFLQTTWKEFQNVHNQLICCAEDEDRGLEYFQENKYGTCELQYLETTDLLATLLASSENGSSTQSTSRSTNLESPGPFARTDVLPKISLPTFDGNYTEWTRFRAYFESLIDNNATLDPIQKLHYLLSSLSGEPRELLKYTVFAPESFASAWALLVARYDNSRSIVTAHLNSLLSLPAMKDDSAASLRALRNRVSEIIASLEAAKRFANVTVPAANVTPGVHGVSDILVCMVASKLDIGTRRAWELHLGDSDELAHFSKLDKFLATRIRGLEACPKISPVDSTKRTSNTSKSQKINAHAVATPQATCPICNNNHAIYKCTTFKSFAPSVRFKKAKDLKLCLNCLGHKHIIAQCGSARTCYVCKNRHHTLLHLGSTKSPTEISSSQMQTSSPMPAIEIPESTFKENVQTLLTAPRSNSIGRVLLATAHVLVRSQSQRTLKVRALLDQGSMRSFVTGAVVNALNIRTKPTNVSLVGIGKTFSGNVTSLASITIGAKTGLGPMFSTDALVLDSLTSYAPHMQSQSQLWPHVEGLSLADDHPANSEPVQILIGADLYGSLLLDGLVRGKSNEPVAQKTVLGWVLSGPTSPPMHAMNAITALHSATDDDLQESLTRFWTVDQVPTAPSALTAAETRCEEHFRNTHARTESGQYIVRLPFKSERPIPIGFSYQNASGALNSLVHKLSRNKDLCQQYVDFIDEYESLGHMQKVSHPVQEDTQVVYLMHHPVLKPSSSTTRLRVVFNASALTTNFTSLNTHLLCGPKLHPELFSVLLQWRAYRYVYSADIAKMYRQILVHPQDRDYQRILWKTSPSDSVQEFQLNTLTYGTVCAPYLALRVLQQLVQDEGQAWPLGSAILQRSIYIDDLLFGADEQNDLRLKRDEVCALLSRGHFCARKWGSNEPALLRDIDSSNHGLAWDMGDSKSTTVKTLGLSWNPGSDSFSYNVTVSTMNVITKRQILSIIARLYDPLGWITPALIRAKIFIQQLWRKGISWDIALAEDVAAEWRLIYDDLVHLRDIYIPRWIGTKPELTSVTLQGFSDASSLAYGAVVYVRCAHADGPTTVSLLASKSRVAPIQTQTIPRLELCGAVLLSRLLESIRTIPEYAHTDCQCWSDSTIVLSWLTGEPVKKDVFVANRISHIQSMLPGVTWRHVPSGDNPADLVSRGISAEELKETPMWWNGPQWLSQESAYWPPELGTISVHLCHSNDEQFLESMAGRFSKWTTLVRVTAYVLRLIIPSPTRPKTLTIDAQEYKNAEQFWFRHIQNTCLPGVKEALLSGKDLPSSHILSSLNPFVDDSGLVRLGGRLSRSKFPYATKYPIILMDHYVSRVFVLFMHLRCLHGGLQLTLRQLRQTVWLIRARHIVRSIVSKCVMCARLKAATRPQLMGSLPPARVSQPEFAFQHTGIDYAGPVSVRESKGRGKKMHPAYIAIFICLASRGVHLELVDDYSTPAFIAALRQFIARRGQPQCLYSDRGTNFQGAQAELTKMYSAAIRSPEFLGFLASEGIRWEFIPPAAPHFGGLWEAGVRSVKHHLRRVLGTHTPTAFELRTLLCQIEACLNSRPLGPLRDDPDDLNALTPSHLIAGREITALPEPSLLDLNPNRLDRWQRFQQILETFWRQWSADYVTSLQQRGKWRIRTEPIKVGQLVLMKNENTPPTRWPLGRVIQCHPGEDGLTRVVSVRTATSVFLRPITKIALLPVLHEDASPAAVTK